MAENQKLFVLLHKILLEFGHYDRKKSKRALCTKPYRGVA